MSEKKFNIDKNKLWQYNDALYTEEFVKQLNEERKKEIQKMLERKAEEKKKQELQRIASQREMEAKWANGEINDVFIRQRLEAKIVAARWALGLGMATTLLFKGQWLMWIAFVIIYFLYVNKIKADAIEADKRRKEFGKKR